MYERPIVMEGPYAAIKTKKGQRVFDDNPLEDEERTRRAEYEDLKIRLESAYRQKVEEVQKVGREVSEHAYARMNQAYMLLQRRSEVDRLQVANESAAMKQSVHPRLRKSSDVEQRGGGIPSVNVHGKTK